MSVRPSARSIGKEMELLSISPHLKPASPNRGADRTRQCQRPPQLSPAPEFPVAEFPSHQVPFSPRRKWVRRVGAAGKSVWPAKDANGHESKSVPFHYLERRRDEKRDGGRIEQIRVRRILVLIFSRWNFFEPRMHTDRHRLNRDASNIEPLVIVTRSWVMISAWTSYFRPMILFSGWSVAE